MNHGLSDQVRAVALEKYVQPAILAGKTQFSVAVRDVMKHLKDEGFPPKNWPQVCTALQAERFLRTNGLEIESVDGPPSKMSSTVVFRYRVANQSMHPVARENSLSKGEIAPAGESPEDWALRVSEKMRGLLKEELAEYGGGEAFLRWIRSEENEENAA